MCDYELIILGGGAMGLASACNAVSPYGDHPVLEGSQVLLLEQYGFFNQQGSSPGGSRQFRVQYSQDYLASLALDAEVEWRKLQQQSVEELVPRVGSLWFGEGGTATQEGGIQEAMKTMEQLGIPYTPLTAPQIEDLYRFRNLPSDYIGFFQQVGGIINVPATLRALYNTAQNRGVDLRDHHKVTDIVSDDKGVTVVTSQGRFRARKLIITPGPFANVVLGHIGIQLNLVIWEMVSAYFRKKSPEIDYPTWFAFQSSATQLYYGFPEASWSHPGYIRVAPDSPFGMPQRPEDRTEPNDADFAGTIAWVAEHMSGLVPTPEFKSTCLIALPNGNKELILDFAPGDKNIVVYTGGWAAKFIPLIGKICVQMALTGRTPYDISHFAMDRPGILA